LSDSDNRRRNRNRRPSSSITGALGRGVLAGGLAEGGGIALDVEQIVSDLERLADHLAVAIHGVAFGRWRVA